MAERKYKHLSRGTLTSADLQTYERVNQAYQDKLGTQNTMQSPYTLDVDEVKVTNRRSAFPSLDTSEYFSSAKYNTKKINMGLSSLVSATMRERVRPDLQPGEIIDPIMGKGMPQYQYNVNDDTNILLYLGAFVIGIVIFTSLV
jgi:hypothetical protein